MGGIVSLSFEAGGATTFADTRLISPAQNSVVSTFAFTVSPAAMPNQTITLEALAVDAAGNTATKAQVILPVADQIPPVVTLDTQTGIHDVSPGQQVAVIVDAGDETAEA